MFYGEIDKYRLVDFLEELYEDIGYNRWTETFPSVVGYESYLPVSFEDAERNANKFRGEEHIIAYEIVKHPDLQPRMVRIIEKVINVNEVSFMWKLYKGEEYPGVSFAFALAIEDAKYLNLFAKLLYSDEFNPKMLNLEYDIIKLVRKWGWCEEIYDLLLVYWFSSGNDGKDKMLEYLIKAGNLDLIELLNKEENISIFFEGLRRFFERVDFDLYDAGDYIGRFDELIGGFLFPGNDQKITEMHNRFLQLFETMKNNIKEDRFFEENDIEVTENEEPPLI
ncbi:MAG: hypothetical protein ACK5M3_13025 [Dysgonomonas sp.]